ncbi:RluA family pseudouridine synthase [Oceaniserpentilla sp. 4NH20-0058]|uniref:pseudouridine synthase n=1 Tax=Oceaniserpentilla sp. 4NH20-0058 TaxID=3127660 RepID=UPI003108F2B2
MNPIDEFIAPVCHEAIEILYQDEHILLINKPSGLLSLSGKHPANQDSVHFRLVQDFPSALLVHRLDFGTSGIMLVALSKEMVRCLNQQFSNREVAKTYTAKLWGRVEQDYGVIDLPIAKGVFPRQQICMESGKSAVSEYQVLARYENATKVLFTPLTGRTHQLRIHSFAIGHPILGCDLYGTQASLDSASRLLLHASALSFTHPTTGKPFLIESPCLF